MAAISPARDRALMRLWKGALAPGVARLAAGPPLPGRRAGLLLLGFFALWAVLQVAALPGLVLVGMAIEDMLAPALGLGAGDARVLALRFDVAVLLQSFPTSASGLLLALASLLGTLGAVGWVRWRGGPTLTELGLRREPGWGHDLALGMALGPLLFAGVLAIEVGLGWATVAPGTLLAPGLAVGALTFTAVAIGEEIVARGIALQVAGRAWGPRVGVAFSAALFGGLHATNPNATGVAVAAIAVAGVVFAGAYLITGRLWLPIAFHWSWNFAQGPLFGFPVSGLPSDGLLTVTVDGPVWATGGAFGPEAGALGLAAALVAGVLMLVWRRGRACA